MDIPITMNFNHGIVQTNIFGLPMNGTYTIEQGYVVLNLNTYGKSESIRGKIQGSQIFFSDVILTKH